LRSPANTEQLGHLVYVISREVLPNPVTGAANVTQTFIEHVDKLALTASGSAVSAVEGAAFSGVVATVSDPNTGGTAAGLTATIDWGDGSPLSNGIVSGGGGSFTVSGGHTYAEEGSFTVTTTVGDAATSRILGTAKSTATVADAPLTAGLIKEACDSGTCVVTFRFTDANPGATVADFTATIDWGDGSSSAGVVTAGGGGFVVTGSHVYADGGSGHAITVSVKDKGGSTVNATTPAANASLTAMGNGFEKGNAQSALFTVGATCSSGVAAARLNGVPVQDGDVVRLKAIKKGEPTVKQDGARLSFMATSFRLVVTCTDAIGNQGAATASVEFATPGQGEAGKGGNPHK
jgi:hypothetical protein